MAMDFGKLNFAVGFNRTSAFPLDANSYFESYDEAVAAAQGAATVGSADSAYYIGQLIIVNDGSNFGLYQIGAGKTLIKFGQATSAEEVAARVTALEGRVTTIEGKLILATTTKEGLMSSEDKAKLDGIATGAQVNVIESVKVDGSPLTVTDKSVDINLSGFATKTALEEVKTTAESAVVANGSITAGTHTKITYDEKGLVTGGSELTADDIPEVPESKITGLTNKLSGYEARIATNETDIDDLQSKITGLTGAMHFVGVSTTDPAGEPGPTIEGVDTFEKGDVCLFGNKEFVYTGTVWVELGDEGSHLTKTEAEATYLKKTEASSTYVPVTRTINSKALNGDITLTYTDVGAEQAGTAAGLIAELDVDALAVSANETVKSISETDGKISVTKQSITIDQSQVNGLTDALNSKQTASTNLSKFDALTGTGLVKKTADGYAVDTAAYITADALTDYAKSADVTSEITSAVSSAKTELTAEINKKQNNITAENKLDGSLISGQVSSAITADKVANVLTAGSKTYNGSEAVEITANDLGALTSVPQATDTEIGGILTGYVSDDTHRAVELDESGKAFVQIPAAITYSAGNGLTLEGTVFKVATGGIVNDMLAVNSVQDKNIVSVSTDKLSQGVNELILDGGTSV